MKTIQDLSLDGKKVLLRVDFNVPLDSNFNVTDQTRLLACVPTINYILSQGASLILMSHLGRPKDGPVEKYSLKHIIKPLEKLLAKPVQFAADCIGEDARQKAESLKPGEILLLENLRFYKEEEKGDLAFAEKLASLGNVYVNDAFGTSHRAHASTAVMAQFFSEKAAGFVMAAEINNAQKVLEQAERPFVAIMGGAKISDKILIIERLLEKVDSILIGGAMAYTFFKAQGGNVGNSLVEEEKLQLALDLLQKAKAKNVQLFLPLDSITAHAFSNDAHTKVENNFHISSGYMGLDIGPEAVKAFSDEIKNAKTILWNGPMGVFEMTNFSNGTNAVANSVVEATKNGAFSLIGGGDSAAAVNLLGYGDQVSYVSTGGGALLEFMEGKALPGVEALG